MQFTAAQIALIINARVEGNPDAVVNSFGKIEEAKRQKHPAIWQRRTHPHASKSRIDR